MVILALQLKILITHLMDLASEFSCIIITHQTPARIRLIRAPQQELEQLRCVVPMTTATTLILSWMFALYRLCPIRQAMCDPGVHPFPRWLRAISQGVAFSRSYRRFTIIRFMAAFPHRRPAFPIRMPEYSTRGPEIAACHTLRTYWFMIRVFGT